MSVWDSYLRRIDIDGETQRDAAIEREAESIKNKMIHSPSFFSVDINNNVQDVVIINTDNLNEKYIYSLPGEDIEHGSIVTWSNNKWLVTEKDSNNTVYVRAKMIQCNYLLKWVSNDDRIIEKWCIVEDGTKYLTGEYEDRHFIVTRGDSRIAITIGKDENTCNFSRGMRFLVDDPDSSFKLAYTLTKPFKLSNIYNGSGVYKFVLQESVVTDDDNSELGIADYYKHFPREGIVTSDPDLGLSDGDSADSKKGWI